MVNGSWLMVRWFDGSMAVVVAVAVVDDGQRLTVDGCRCCCCC